LNSVSKVKTQAIYGVKDLRVLTDNYLQNS